MLKKTGFALWIGLTAVSFRAEGSSFLGYVELAGTYRPSSPHALPSEFEPQKKSLSEPAPLFLREHLSQKRMQIKARLIDAGYSEDALVFLPPRLVELKPDAVRATQYRVRFPILFKSMPQLGTLINLLASDATLTAPYRDQGDPQLEFKWLGRTRIALNLEVEERRLIPEQKITTVSQDPGFPLIQENLIQEETFEDRPRHRIYPFKLSLEKAEDIGIDADFLDNSQRQFEDLRLDENRRLTFGRILSRLNSEVAHSSKANVRLVYKISNEEGFQYSLAIHSIEKASGERMDQLVSYDRLAHYFYLRTPTFGRLKMSYWTRLFKKTRHSCQRMLHSTSNKIRAIGG